MADPKSYYDAAREVLDSNASSSIVTPNDDTPTSPYYKLAAQMLNQSISTEGAAQPISQVPMKQQFVNILTRHLPKDTNVGQLVNDALVAHATRTPPVEPPKLMDYPPSPGYVPHEGSGDAIESSAFQPTDLLAGPVVETPALIGEGLGAAKTLGNAAVEDGIPALNKTLESSKMAWEALTGPGKWASMAKEQGLDELAKGWLEAHPLNSRIAEALKAFKNPIPEEHRALVEALKNAAKNSAEHAGMSTEEIEAAQKAAERASEVTRDTPLLKRLKTVGEFKESTPTDKTINLTPIEK